MASLGDDLLVTVNKLQDLVFNTIGNDSLDLPQIVSNSYPFMTSGTARSRRETNDSFRSWLVLNRLASRPSWRTSWDETSYHAVAESSLGVP